MDGILKRAESRAKNFAGAGHAVFRGHQFEGQGRQTAGISARCSATAGIPPELSAAAFSLNTNSNQRCHYHGCWLRYRSSCSPKPPAKKMALTDKRLPMSDETIADKINDFLVQQKTQKLAPAYLSNLKKDADTEIPGCGFAESCGCGSGTGCRHQFARNVALKVGGTCQIRLAASCWTSYEIKDWNRHSRRDLHRAARCAVRHQKIGGRPAHKVTRIKSLQFFQRPWSRPTSSINDLNQESISC